MLNNILVCDDDTAIVDSIEIYLQQEGYHVIKAYDGVQALEVLHKEEIQLVIIDVMMPRLDGIRAILNNPGREQYANHCAVSKDSRFRQDSRIECRSG